MQKTNSDMQIEKLDRPAAASQDEKLENQYVNLQAILDELRSRDIPEETIGKINQEIRQVNSYTGTAKEVKKKIKSARSNILKLLEKELNLVPKSHYRNQWMAIGMSAFGLPLGVAFGASLGNMAFLSIGLPIGMAIGIAVGSGMDQKAQQEGRQLNVDLVY